jgi:hypothetical protein
MTHVGAGSEAGFAVPPGNSPPVRIRKDLGRKTTPVTHQGRLLFPSTRKARKDGVPTGVYCPV